MQKLLDPVQTALASTTDTKTTTVDPLGIDFGMGSAQPLSYIEDGIIVWWGFIDGFWCSKRCSFF